MKRSSWIVKLMIMISCLLLAACQSSATPPEEEQKTTKQEKEAKKANKNKTPPAKDDIPMKQGEPQPHKNNGPTSKADKHQKKPVAQGVITKVDKLGKKKVKIYLNEKSDQGKPGGKGMFTVDQNTNIRYKGLQTFAAVTIKDLKINKKVSVWCSGVHPMIFPPQCHAGEVVLEN